MSEDVFILLKANCLALDGWVRGPEQSLKRVKLVDKKVCDEGFWKKLIRRRHQRSLCSILLLDFQLLCLLLLELLT